MVCLSVVYEAGGGGVSSLYDCSALSIHMSLIVSYINVPAANAADNLAALGFRQRRTQQVHDLRHRRCTANVVHVDMSTEWNDVVVVT